MYFGVIRLKKFYKLSVGLAILSRRELCLQFNYVFLQWFFFKFKSIRSTVKAKDRTIFSGMVASLFAISFSASRTLAGTSHLTFLLSYCICWKAVTPPADWSINPRKSHICFACPPSLSSPASEKLSRCHNTGSPSCTAAASAAPGVLDIVINLAFPILMETSLTLRVIKNPSLAHFWPQVERGGT